MALGRIKPYLIDVGGAYANQVLTFNVATSSVSWEHPTGGDSFATTNASTITIQAGNVIPTGNAVYSLGGPEAYWKDLYVSDGTIILGNASISLDESANVVFTNRVTSQPAKIAVDEIVIGRGDNKKSIKLDENDTTKIRFGSAKLDTAKDEDFSAELGNVSSNVDLVQSNVSSLPDSAANDHATYTSLSTLVNTVQSNLTSVIGASPSALDTLAEISAALENDANVAVTLTNKIDTVSSNAKFDSSDFWGFYSNESELTSNYIHGAFAHVHSTGAAYYGHAGYWVRLANHGDLTVDNNTWVNANDHSTYTTLSGLIDTVQDNVASGSGGGGASNNTFVNSNDHVTYTTLTANTYNTYTTLSGLIDTVQDNVGSGGGSGSSGASGGIPISDTFTTVATGNTFTLSESVSDANSLIVSFQGINQIPNDDYVVFGTTLTLNNTYPITAGLKLEVRHLKLLTVTNTDATIATATSAQTVFTSPFDTNDPNDIIVTVDGLMQRPTTDYTVSGTTVTFGSAPPVGTSVMVRHAAVTTNNPTGSSVSWTWEEQSSDFTAEVSYRYFIDSSSSAVTATLPVSATLGDEIRFIDATGSANVNSITISRNSHKIQGIAEDLIINTHRAALGLVYYNSTHGWLKMEV